MAHHEQERRLSELPRLRRAETNAEPLSTVSGNAVGSNHIKSVRPFTTLVTATLTDAISLEQLESTPAPSHSHPLSPNSPVDAPASSSHQSSTSSPHVPSESDVPKKWAAVYLDGERDRQFRFLGGMTLVCVLTVIGIVATVWWR
jgi:hypothetical protein